MCYTGGWTRRGDVAKLCPHNVRKDVRWCVISPGPPWMIHRRHDRVPVGAFLARWQEADAGVAAEAMVATRVEL